MGTRYKLGVVRYRAIFRRGKPYPNVSQWGHPTVSGGAGGGYLWGISVARVQHPVKKRQGLLRAPTARHRMG